jgi:hypothetical protein
MIVVADSGPLHYLILLEHIELLRRSTAKSWYRSLSLGLSARCRASHRARVDQEAAHLGRSTSRAG